MNQPTPWQNTLTPPIRVRVTPKAAANKIVPEEQADGTLLLKIYVTTVPEDGKANAAVLKLLAKELGCPKSALILLRGQTGRDKLIDLKTPRKG